MANDEKYSFESKRENTPAPSTLKIDNKRSRYGRQIEAKQAFDQQAEEAHNKLIGRQGQIFELGKKFIEIMEDKTLTANKGPMQQSMEREILNKLITFAVEVNTDQLEQEGMGSVGLLILLFRSNLAMRDKYNSLEYKFEQLEKKLKEAVPQNNK